jgi:hypothetical protein
VYKSRARITAQPVRISGDRWAVADHKGVVRAIEIVKNAKFALREVWKTQLPDIVWSAPFVSANGQCVVGCDDDSVYRLDAAQERFWVRQSHLNACTKSGMIPRRRVATWTAAFWRFPTAVYWRAARGRCGWMLKAGWYGAIGAHARARDAGGGCGRVRVFLDAGRRNRVAGSGGKGALQERAPGPL